MTAETSTAPRDNEKLRSILDQTADEQRAEFMATGWWHSIDLGDGRITPGVHRIEELRDNYERFGLPRDMTGMRVLDIGCWDGFYSFESERRGAEVVAVDVWRPEKFFAAREALGSRIEFHELSVYEVTRERLGRFDVVLFLGVLYHLRHPLLALERVCEVTRDLAIVESHVIDNVLSTERPVMEFYELDELGGQYDNWWGPNVECLMQMARAAGFVSAEALRRDDLRGVIRASRQWSGLTSQGSPTIRITDILNAIRLDRYYPRQGKHAYLTLWVEGMPATATRDDVKVTLGGYGVRPVFVGASQNPADEVLRMQINIAVPPGLDTGQSSVQVFYGDKSSDVATIELSEGSQW